MSAKKDELYDLLDSSFEDMLLYSQEVLYHFANDMEKVSEELDALYGRVGLTKGCDFLLMSALPADGKPLKGKMYLEKNGTKLKCIGLTHRGTLIDTILDINARELTDKWLEENTSILLKEMDELEAHDQHWSGTECKFEFKPTLDNLKEDKIKGGIIYIDSAGNYLIRDPKGAVQKGFVEGIQQLNLNIQFKDVEVQRKLKEAILPVATENGHVLVEREVTSERNEKIKEWKRLAQATDVYKEFSRKYWAEIAEKLLGMSGIFTGNPTAIGADENPQIIEHVYNSKLELQQGLLKKYPRVKDVVEYMRTSYGTSKEEYQFCAISDLQDPKRPERGKIYIDIEKNVYYVLSTSGMVQRCRFQGLKLSDSGVLPNLSNLTEKNKQDILKAIAKDTGELTFGRVLDKRPNEIVDSVLLAKLASLLTAKEKVEAAVSSYVDVMIYQKNRVLANFLGFVPKSSDEIQTPSIISKPLDSSDSEMVLLKTEISSPDVDIERGIEKLIEEKKVQLRTEQNAQMRNKIAAELAILQGKNTFTIIKEDGQETISEVSSIIGFNTADMTALQRLEIADKIESLKATLFYKQIESAILNGDQIVEVVVNGEKQSHRISSIIGFDTANMSASGRKKTAEHIDALKIETNKMNVATNEQEKEQSAQRLLDFLLSIKRTEIEESAVNGKSTREQIARRNQIALETSFLGKKGKISFNMVVSGERRKKTEKVTDIIGPEQDPSKMTPSERLKAVNNIEQLKSDYAEVRINSAAAAIAKRVETMEKNIAALESMGLNTNKEERQYCALREAHIILKGRPSELAPRIDSKGNIQHVEVFTEESPTVIRRLEMFEAYRKEHKRLFSDSTITQLLNFIGIVKNFLIKKPKKAEELQQQSNLRLQEYAKPRFQRSVSCSQLPTAPEKSRTRSLTAPKAATSPNAFLRPPSASAQKTVDNNRVEAVASARITPTPLSGDGG